MKTLLVTAGLFFTLTIGLMIYFVNSDPGNEYDLTLVVPIDQKDMPKMADQDGSNTPAGLELRTDIPQNPVQPDKPPFRFNDRPAAPNEMRASE